MAIKDGRTTSAKQKTREEVTREFETALAKIRQAGTNDVEAYDALNDLVIHILFLERRKTFQWADIRYAMIVLRGVPERLASWFTTKADLEAQRLHMLRRVSAIPGGLDAVAQHMADAMSRM